MRTSAEICEELLLGLNKKDLDNLKQETTTLKNYGVLSFEDYQKVNGAIEEEAALRFNRYPLSRLSVYTPLGDMSRRI